jgi:hypothetical protein
MNHQNKMNDMLKRSKPSADVGPEASQGETQFRDNPKVNARIDEYIKNNPKHWEYVQAMPRDRLERALVLSEVQKLDRLQKMRDGIKRKLDENPEMKQAYETLVKHLPEDQREKTMVAIAGQAMRQMAPRRTENQAQTQTPRGVTV